MVGLISFLAVLLAFFTIDIRSRDTDRDLGHVLVFEYPSRVGGIPAAIAIASGWVVIVTEIPTALAHLVLLAIPGSLSVLGSIVLGVEMLFAAEVPDSSETETPDSNSGAGYRRQDENVSEMRPLRHAPPCRADYYQECDL